MAEKSNEQFVPEIEDFKNFAEGLVNYVMFLNSTSVSLKTMQKFFGKSYVYKGFHEHMKRTVHFINNRFNINKGDILQIHKVKLSSMTYSSLVKTLIEQYFPEDFEVKSFLFFCVHIAKMAAMCFIEDITGPPMIAQMYIINILKQHMTVDRWNNLHRICIECACMSRENCENDTKRKLILSSDEENDSSSSSKKFSQ